jgi:spore maturation protein CgeB
LEPRNLIEQYGMRPIRDFHIAFPNLRSRLYELRTLDLDKELRGADLVIAHEWNDPELIAALGRHRDRKGGHRLLFHDTHHRAVTAPQEMERFDLRSFDGILAFGEVLADIYRKRLGIDAVWTWHEAADTRVFRPIPGDPSSTSSGSAIGATENARRS